MPTTFLLASVFTWTAFTVISTDIRQFTGWSKQYKWSLKSIYQCTSVMFWKKNQHTLLIILNYGTQACRKCAKTINNKNERIQTHCLLNASVLCFGRPWKKASSCPSGILVIIHLWKCTAHCGVPQESASHFYQCQSEAWQSRTDTYLKRSEFPLCMWVLILILSG